MDSRRRMRKWITVLALAAVVVFCLFFFHVRTVSVEGNTFYSEEKMAETFQDNVLYRNVLTFWLMNKLSLTPKLPYVREYEVSYPSPSEIHIRLYEKSIVAGISYASQYIYFDKDGMVLLSASEPKDKVPLFETESLTTFTIYEKVKMEDEEQLAQIMNLSNLFQHYGITWDRVRFNEKDEVFLYSGDIRVLLGRQDNYDEEISALSGILDTAHEKNLKGDLDMKNYEVGGDVILEKKN